MDIKLKLVYSTMLVLVLSILAHGPLWAHSEEHIKEVPAHDPLVTEFGEFDPSMMPVRMIRIVMSDRMNFVPKALYFQQGEVVKLIFSNTGKMVHEFLMGSSKELERHARLMTTQPTMEHEEPHMIHLDPGTSGSLTWKFSQPGEFSFACLIPGHLEAGMVGKIIVQS